jgi:TolB-like protein
MKKILLLFAVIFFLGCQTVPKGPALMDQETGIDLLIKSLEASKEMKGKNIGVGDFIGMNGEVDAYSRGIANKIEIGLSKVAPQKDFHVINRQNFYQLAQEWQLNLSGAVDSSTAKKVGSLLGIDVLITGNLSDAGDAMDIAAKGIDTETGKVLWGERVKFKKDKEQERILLTKKMETEPIRDGEIKVELWSDKPVYKTGEIMTLHFKTNRDCYVTLVDVGTSGKVHILYPNRFSGGSKVLAGKVYSIPGRDDGYAITVLGPQGTEVVRAIATLTPIAMTEIDFSKEGGVFKKVDEPTVLTRDLNIVAKKTSPSSRGEGLIRIEIKE